MVGGASSSPYCDPWWWESQLTLTPQCRACNGYYGPCFSEPVCATCHAFLYASSLEQEVVVSVAEGDESDDCDSGNDEPPASDFLLERGPSFSGLVRQAAAPVSPPSSPGSPPGSPSLGLELMLRASPPPPQLEALAPLLQLLSLPQPHPLLPTQDGMVASLPPEVLLKIFKHLDDISLYAVGNVCTRWRQLLTSRPAQAQWQRYTRRRWPLFDPMVHVKDWFMKFSSLMNSCFCLKCCYQMWEQLPPQVESSPPRDKRLGHDLKGLAQDAPEGIEAKALDSSYFHWQASITGPVGSPYEGGVFYLYLKVPMQYPFKPPEVRFLTKIFHPNVNRHGDIGIDSLQPGNWVSGLTLTKVLLSIQSLLTDPYTHICMEPQIGQLYNTDRETFDSIARQWCHRFAMHDLLINCEVMDRRGA